jgi:hypothetical protein
LTDNSTFYSHKLIPFNWLEESMDPMKLYYIQKHLSVDWILGFTGTKTNLSMEEISLAEIDNQRVVYKWSY